MAKETPVIEFQYDRGDERLTEFGAVIPAGWYKGKFVDLEGKESQKDGSGGYYVNMQFEVTEGAHKGTALFEMFFPWAENEKTAQATRRRLNSVLEAIDLPTMTSFNELIGLEMMIKVKTQEEREVEDENTGEMKKFPARSQIVNYKSVTDYVPEEEPEPTTTKSAPTKSAPSKPAFGSAKKSPPAKKEEAEEETTKEET
ncbi:DUF669 domain-containing protein, partial [Xanthomonas citri pv. citri]|nr:DUF669 domain-containing protein [Xanthomonas citri pv. citri]